MLVELSSSESLKLGCLCGCGVPSARPALISPSLGGRFSPVFPLNLRFFACFLPLV